MHFKPEPAIVRPLKSRKWICRNALMTDTIGETRCDIAIEDGIIIEIGDNLRGNFSRELDLSDHRVIPGCIDPHVHFALPVGHRISADNFLDGSRKALAGGVTTVFDFTTPIDGMDLAETLRLRRLETRQAECTVFLHATVVGWDVEMQQHAEECLAQGVRSFKFFTTYEESGRRTSWEALEDAARWIAEVDARMIIHAEDQDSLVPVDQLPSDSFRYYEASRPVAAEVRAIQTLADIQRRTGATMAIVHVSSGAGVEAARESGLYLESCSQYLTLTRDKFLEPSGWRYAVAPPLRSIEEQNRLWQAISDNRIHWIGSDHAPFPIEEYDEAGDHFTKTPFGLDSVGLTLRRLVSHGVQTGRITWNQLVSLTSCNAARFYGIYPEFGTISVGSRADLTAIHLETDDITVLD